MKKVLLTLILFISSLSLGFISISAAANPKDNPNDPAYTRTHTFTYDQYTRREYREILSTHGDPTLKRGMLYITTLYYFQELFETSQWSTKVRITAYDVSYVFQMDFEEMGLPTYNGKSKFVAFRALESINLNEKGLCGVICWSSKSEYVPEDNKPSIGVGVPHFVVNVNNMISKEEILSHVTVTDDYDKNITPTIASSTYDPNNKKIGKYQMVVEAVDSSNNKASVTISIHVVDIDKPVINGPSSLEIEYSELPSIDELKAKFSVNDNYDTSLTPTVVRETFTSLAGKLGSAQVVLSATDSSGNSSGEFICNIKVKDTQKPIISVEGVDSRKELKVPNNKLLTLEEFKAKINASDDYDKNNVTVVVEGYEAYTSSYQVSHKTHPITIKVTDQSNNMQTLTINLIVEDKVAPNFNFDEYFVVLAPGVELTPEQIKDLASKVAGVNVNDIKDVTLTDENKIKKARITLNNDKIIDINIELSKGPDTVKMVWFHYIYKWLTILFNIDAFYRTDNFFDFKTRVKSLVEVYNKGVFYNH